MTTAETIIKDIERELIRATEKMSAMLPPDEFIGHEGSMRMIVWWALTTSYSETLHELLLDHAIQTNTPIEVVKRLMDNTKQSIHLHTVAFKKTHASQNTEDKEVNGGK